MEETPATQYIFSRATPLYHLAKNDTATLCGVWVLTRPDQRRRIDDLQITDERPQREFDALCPHCYRISNDIPEPEIDWRLFYRGRLMDRA